MAQPYVTGPVALWVAFYQGQIVVTSQGTVFNVTVGQPQFLGHGEDAPEIDHRPQFEPVMCDLTGTRIPLDVADENEDAIVSVSLVRWNDPILRLLQARPGPVALAGQGVARPPLGGRRPGDIGTLYLNEGAAFMLWCYFPYQKKPVYGTEVPGYRYPGCYLRGPDALRKNGTRARAVQSLFHALPVLVAQGNQTGGTMLYDNDMTAVENLPIN
jgi:hypothetical protein